MCPYPWSNRDLFDIYSDCHIHQPAYIFLNVLVLLCAIFNLFFSLQQTFKQTWKPIPLSVVGQSILLILIYGIILGLDISFADRNLGLNVLQGLGLFSVYFNVGLTSIRHLEVVMTVDAHTAATSTKFRPFLVRMNFGILIVSFFGIMTGLIVPTVVPRIDFAYFLATIQLIIAWINAIPRMLYARKLLNIITESQTAQTKNLYDPIRKYLKGLQISTVGTMFYVTLTNLAWMFIPIIKQNSYTVYNTAMVLVPVTSLISLLESRSNTKKTEDTNSKQNSAPISKNKGEASTTQKLESQKPSPDHLQFSRSIVPTGGGGVDEIVPFVEMEDLIGASRSPFFSSGTEQKLQEDDASPPIWNPFTYPFPKVDSEPDSSYASV